MRKSCTYPRPAVPKRRFPIALNYRAGFSIFSRAIRNSGVRGVLFPLSSISSRGSSGVLFPPRDIFHLLHSIWFPGDRGCFIFRTNEDRERPGKKGNDNLGQGKNNWQHRVAKPRQDRSTPGKKMQEMTSVPKYGISPPSRSGGSDGNPDLLRPNPPHFAETFGNYVAIPLMASKKIRIALRGRCVFEYFV